MARVFKVPDGTVDLFKIEYVGSTVITPVDQVKCDQPPIVVNISPEFFKAGFIDRLKDALARI